MLMAGSYVATAQSSTEKLMEDSGGIEDDGGDGSSVEGQPASAQYNKKTKKWKIRCGSLPGLCYTSKVVASKPIIKVYVNGDKNPPVEIETE